jgi:pimeloyl-ACP methyl ester carboxylesterase/phosphohistidine swiveling domain-containing protein
MSNERPILVLVGGNGSTRARFGRALPLLARCCRPVVVELAGQGSRAAVPVPKTLTGFATDLAGELASATSGQPFVAYGHGIGGLVLAHALRQSRLPAERLVLHAPVGAHLVQRRFPWLMAWAPLRALVQRMLGSRWLGPPLARRLMEPGGAATAEDLRAFAAGYREARSFGALFAAADPLAALDGLDELTLPVTLLWGGADRVLRVEQLPAWAEVLRRAPVIARVEPEWRHYPFLDRPAEFAAVLAACVAECAGAPPDRPPTADRQEGGRLWRSAVGGPSSPAALPQEPIALDALRTFRPRTKAGRLAALRRAGLPVPAGWWVPPEALANGSASRLFATLPRDRRYAVRSSAVDEDQAERTAAGIFHSELEVAPPDLAAACERVAGSGQAEYFNHGRPPTADRRPPGPETGVSGAPAPSDDGPAKEVEAVADGPRRVEVVVQEMAPRAAGGVAWVRALGIDLEIGAGAIERSVAGSEPVTRLSLSRLGAPWEQIPPELPAGLTAVRLRRELWPLLRRAHRLFDLGALDVEWTFAPEAGFRLVQARPVGERHGPRRLLSAANLREVLPPDPSPFLIGATAAVSLTLPRYYARHDRAVATWREPFSVVVGGRSYLNADLFAALMDRWGLPRRRVAQTIGGRLPAAPVRIDRALRAMPALLRQARDLCRVPAESNQTLAWLRGTLIQAEDLPALAGWFVAAFGALVTANLRIGGALFLAAPWRGPQLPEVVTARMARELRIAQQAAAGRGDRTAATWREFVEQWGHRGEYESDPARPRGAETGAPGAPLPLEPSPFLPDPLAALPAPLRALPFLAPGHLLAHREWFRDGVMRLWAAFRARTLQHARELANAGVLETPEDLWWLTPEEIRTLPASAWGRRAAARREAPPEPAIPADLFWSDTLAPLDHPGGGQLPLVPGVVTGPALVARTPSEALALLERLPAGDGAPVLLAPAVDPGWLPVFVRVAGVATELGGRLSHAAILLRELGIPSVLNLAGVTATARTGERVRLVVPPGRVERVVEARSPDQVRSNT